MKKRGVNAALSHSNSDTDSEEINAFKDNKYGVLIVVNRARLGYSDVDLMNIIDMGGSHNPNILFQMIMRLSRGTPDTQKHYLKVTPKEMYNMTLTELSMDAALMLTSKEFLLTYNGRNFNDIHIPILKKKRANLIGSLKKKSSGQVINSTQQERKQVSPLPEYTNDVIKMFSDILHDLNSPLSIYKMTTIRAVKNVLGHKTPMKHTRESIFASAMGITYEE